MNSYNITPSQSRSRAAQLLFSLFLGICLFLVTLTLVFLGYQIWFTGRIYAGISIGGIPVGGLSPKDAAVVINENIQYPTKGRLLLRDGELSWMVSPQEIGATLDVAASVNHAYAYGRTNIFLRLKNQFDALCFGVDLSPVLVYDERIAYEFLSAMSVQISQPVIEAHLEQQDTELVVVEGQNGRDLDISATLHAIGEQISTMQDGVVDLAVQVTPVVKVDVEEQNAVVHNILSQPLTLVMPENQPDQKGPWVIEPQALSTMLLLERSIENGSDEYHVNIKTESLRAFLNDQYAGLQLYARNARFHFDEEAQQFELFQPSITGRMLDIEASIVTIQEKVLQGEHTTMLQFTFTPPQITDNASAQELGITALIQSQTSYFYGSSAPRIQNITAAAHQFNGLLVSPGETFSMAEIIGDISLDNGYAEAPIIYGDQTIEGVGGGVCQVSTTLFRTAFFAGFPIVERYPHAYRVVYYEKDAANQTVDEWIGLDATVYIPLIDFKFTNDTPYWLLMETIVNQAHRYITWNFYSTPDGRSVEWETTGPTNIVPQPETLYMENPDLDEGEIEQVDWGVDGADVTVKRTVKNGDTVLYQDTFFTHYEPWRDIYEYGPGTENIPSPDESDEEVTE